jgi:beta-lactamase class A
MITASSNLATDLLLEQLGLDAVAAASPPGLQISRPIGDHAAAGAGLTNTATAAATGALLAAIVQCQAAGPEACAEMLMLLEAQTHPSQIATALPAGTRAGTKGGWVPGVRHDAAVIHPSDAPLYVLVICTTGFDQDRADALIRAVAEASWADRHRLTAPAAAIRGRPEV